MGIRVRESGKELRLVILGTLILSFGTAVFLLPYDMVAGGVSGIAIILHATFPSLEVDGIIAILTWGLFFLGWIVLGGRFAWGTLVSSFVYPIGIAVFSRLLSEESGIFPLREQDASVLVLLTAAVVGGALVGAGCALTFLGGGSTGGTDILAFSACKLFAGMRHAVAMLLIDILIIFAGFAVLGNPIRSIFGIASASVGSLTIDCILRASGGK